VTLTAEEREALGGMISRGKADARVLLQADASEGGPDWTDTRIAEAVRVSVPALNQKLGYPALSRDSHSGSGFTHEVSVVEYDARAGSCQSSPT